MITDVSSVWHPVTFQYREIKYFFFRAKDWSNVAGKLFSGGAQKS
jgi:hypothetical protein